MHIVFYCPYESMCLPAGSSYDAKTSPGYVLWLPSLESTTPQL